MESPLRNHMEETFLTILIWIGMWGIATHVITMYCKSSACEILLYAFLVIFGYYALYVRNHI
jgi:succinate dehydrogenase hydrophobic anchor subunit